MNVFAHIAQSVEHFLGKEEVTGSNPVMSSILVLWRGWFFKLYDFRFLLTFLLFYQC